MRPDAHCCPELQRIPVWVTVTMLNQILFPIVILGAAWLFSEDVVYSLQNRRWAFHYGPIVTLLVTTAAFIVWPTAGGYIGFAVLLTVLVLIPLIRQRRLGRSGNAQRQAK